MKTKLSIYAVALGLSVLTIANSAKAQVQVDLQSFTSCALPASITALPSTSSDWQVDDGSCGSGSFPSPCPPASIGYTVSSGTSYSVPASAGCHLLAIDGADPSGTETVTYTISTAAFQNLTIIWGAFKQTGFPTLSLQYSLTGLAGSYTPIAYTEVGVGAWALVNGGTPISLPSACNNKNILYLQWSFLDDGNGVNPMYAWDDIQVVGTISRYFSATTGNLDVLTNWGTNLSGSPIVNSPANFTTAGITYEIVNQLTPTIGAAWTVSGTGSKVRVGDSTNIPAINFTIPGSSAYTGTIDVMNNGTLTISNTTIPTPGTFTTGSTVNYAAAGAQTVTPTAYYNLTISGGGTKTIGTTNSTTVTATLNLSTNTDVLALVNSAFKYIILNGPLTGLGTITGNSNAVLLIEGSGTFGTINFTGGAQILKKLNNTRTGTYTITLGTPITIGTQFEHTGGTLNLNGQTLTTATTCGGITLGGTVSTGTTTTSSLLFNGSSATVSGSLLMDQSTPGTTNKLSTLLFNTASGKTLTLGNSLSIIDSIVPTLGTIAAGTNTVDLVFSSATKTGRVGRMSASGGALTGSNITTHIQRPGGNTQWCLMGLPGILPAAGNFTVYEGQFPMTCASCPDGTDGGFTSVYSYSEPTEAYNPISNTTNAISNGQGYWFYMGLTAGTTAAIPIHVAGTAATATAGISFPLTYNTGAQAGYNLIANPVPSPISWKMLLNGNPSVSTTYAVYSPNSGTGGGYVYYQTGSPGVSTGSPTITDAIQQGQGFYVQALAATSLNLTEGCKVNGGTQALERGANPSVQSSAINYFRIDVSNSSAMDEVVLEFNPNAVTGRDIYDAQKLPPATAGQLQIASPYSSTIDFVINANPALTQNYSIPVKMTTGTTGTYTINAADLANMPGGCLSLHDNYTGIDHDLRAGAFSLTLTDTETVARFVVNITVTPLTITANATQASCPNINNGLITAVGTNAGPWNYVWKNASGTVVKTSLGKTTADSLTGLNNGVYSVEVTTVGSCDDATQTFTITAPAAPISAFTIPSATVNVSSTVTFTNSSTNASNFWWTFGDGGVSNQAAPTYTYNTSGTYSVTLSAINASCNDTVNSTQVIQVDATMGIKQANSGSGDIILSRDGSGNYLQFDYPNQTKVNITVCNVLGQNLLNNSGLTVVNDRIYLNVNDSKNQVLYVTITNLNNNQQTTKKFVND
ncbi:MAG: PKD domain-containing protein [Bacteroidia bacterium]